MYLSDLGVLSQIDMNVTLQPWWNFIVFALTFSNLDAPAHVLLKEQFRTVQHNIEKKSTESISISTIYPSFKTVQWDMEAAV